ncbi:hypothetical protein ACOMHN_015175 [Nucella lapillus]
MLTVCVTVVLTAVVLAQADQMSDLLHLPAHKDHLYIYDVTSEASVEDLKAALANFTLGGGGCSEAFEMRIRETAEGFRKLHSLITPKIYIVLASYPPKGLEFMEMADNAFQNFLRFAAAAGVFADSVKRIVKI